MKARSIFVGLLLALPTISNAQGSPGGVMGTSVWLKADSLGRIPVMRLLTGKGQDLIRMKDGVLLKKLNFNPAVRLFGTDSNAISLNLGDTLLNHCTLFTVYQPFDTFHENVIWHTTKAGKASLIMTTARAADLTKAGYMNFRDMQLGYPKIGIFSQHEKDSLPATQYWNIGYRPASPRLPVVSLSGLLPEAIAYSRVLGDEERLRVGSYLAIKYGITLSDPGIDYVNSKGDRIWLGSGHNDFHHHVAGIARDDASGLVQTKSSSTEEPDILVITNRDTLADRTALVWGDNNLALKNDDARQGLPPFLRKRWLFVPTGGTKTIVTDLEINTEAFDVAMSEKPIYWLGIDTTASPVADPNNVMLVKMSSINKNAIATFNGLQWNKTAIIYLAVAGELLVKTSVTGPDCGSGQSGLMNINIAGGTPPFVIEVQNEANGKKVQNIASAERKIQVRQILAGTYAVRVQDEMHNTYNQSIYVNSLNGPTAPSVIDRYTLPASGGCITISADSGVTEAATYHWSGPQNFDASGPVVQLCKAGIYTLLISEGSCEFRKNIIVAGSLNDKLLISKAWPNPSPGPYNVRVSLPERAPLKMMVMSADGLLIEQKNGYGNSSEYLFNGSFNRPGVYFFYFEAGKYNGSLKFIVRQ